MSINSPSNSPISGSRIFDDYKVQEGSSRSFSEENQFKKAEQDSNSISDFDLFSFKKPYNIPLGVVRAKMKKTYDQIESVLDIYESMLENVYINPNIDPNLEETHIYLWKEINKNYPQNIDEDLKNKFPLHISFKQYLYAEDHGCRICRKFVKEYDKTISHSMFVHFFDFRYYLKLLLHEAHCIKESLLYDFGTEYQDESQEQIAVVYFSWAKMAENHTRLIAEELSESKRELPSAEMDKISKKQAAQLQAFFSIRIAAYTETIDNLLFSAKKYLVDTCDVFYKKYVTPSLKFKAQVAAPLELDILTSRMSLDAPVISEEIATAVAAFRGNFGSILTDMVQRRNNIQEKFDKLFSFNRQRKKYIDYIDQLSEKASSRPNIIVKVEEDEYSSIFDSIVIDPGVRTSLNSGHGDLDDLLEDHHPQYLLRSGGTIFGDITVEDGIKIDGVDISEHAHTGEDGSVRIKSTDIDYETPRDEITIMENADGNLLQVSVESFSSTIRDGGIPSTSASIMIEVPDELADTYDFEISYMENM